MRYPRLFFWFFAIALTSVFLTAIPVSARYDYIRISDPFLRKVPIAIPAFKGLDGGIPDPELAIEAADIMSETLEFTGYFRFIHREAYLVDADRLEIVIEKINFRDWTGIGAELLVTGGYLIAGDELTLDLRLIDPFEAKLLVGKRYRGRREDRRRMIQRFCSDVVFNLTGNRGIFNSRIAFESTGSGHKEIYLCEFDGHKPRRFSHTENITISPAWSSDGKWLAYTAYAKGKPDIYIKHIKDKHGAVISRKGINITPAWTPGQFTLAATLSFSGDPEIYLLTGGGKIIKRITKSWGIDVSPTWSPDGKQMAFVSNRSGTPQIYIRHMDTGQVKRLSFEGRYNTSPSWSPRGDRIAYTGSVNGSSISI